ncbi:MAG: hypothetical protein ABIO17_03255 [Pseudoxanthomonas sp.]
MHFRIGVVMACAVVVGACQAGTPSSTLADATALSEETSAQIAVPPAANTSELSSYTDELMADQLDAFVEGNGRILDSQQGDLKGTGERGAVLVLDHPGAGNEKLGEGVPRTVLLIVRNGAGKLQKVRKNDKLVPCAQCGGMAGDPFGYIQVGKGQFKVVTEGGSRERWSDEYAFKYATEQRDWLLDKVVRTVIDTGTGEVAHIELNDKDFNTIRFEEFDPETLPKVEGK